MTVEIIPSDFTILIVDDVATNVLLLQSLLKRQGYNFLTTNNGPSALKIMEEQQPDLVLLDIMMPGMSGFDVADRASENPATKDIPIVFVTALNEPNNIVEGFQHGCNDFITKPFNTAEIMIRVRHQLALVQSKRIIMQRNEELRNAINDRDQLYAVVAHDLRSPLDTIKTILGLLNDTIQAEDIGEDLYDLLHSTTSSVDDLFALLNSLLSWTKFQIGALSFKPTPFVFTDAVNEAIKTSKATAQLKNIKVVTQNECSDSIVADMNMIMTVIRNLLSNALKFSEDDSTITIRTYTEGDSVVCSVKDQGCGLSEEMEDMLNSEQVTADYHEGREKENSGLGLKLCSDFVKRNGGKLWHTNNPDGGATFSFSIPMNKE